jgi:glucokinase
MNAGTELFSRPVLCVDIGGTSTKAGILEMDGHLKFVDSIPSGPHIQAYFEALLRLIRQARERTHVSHRQPVAEMGISVAGFLDDARTRMVYNPNLNWLENFPLRDRICEAFPELRVELEVDSNASAMAEYRLGSGRGVRRFLCVTCGTGLGAGMVVDGRPLRFAYGCMGDIGHVIVKRDGAPCTCGGRGCAEAMISAPALAERYRSRAGVHENVTLRNVIEAANAGDQHAMDVIHEAGEWLGVALASMANALLPDHITIAGGLSAALDLLVEPANRVFRDSASIIARSHTTLAIATLRSTASLVGAAWPFWDEKLL